MAPTVETPVEKKKSGFRRLLSPVIFGETQRRKEMVPTRKVTPESKSLETAFVGTSSTARRYRSQSTSPSREAERSHLLRQTLDSESSNGSFSSISSANSDHRSGRTSAPPAPYSQYYNKSGRMSEKDYVIKRRSPIVFDRATNNIKSVNYGQRTILRPQPLYTNERPKSVSPDGQQSFVRGGVQRSTINSYHPVQPSAIYENTNRKTVSRSPALVKTPIFKRGALQGDVSPVNGGLPKKVSFSPTRVNVNREQIYWPTRKGPATNPPTRQSTRKEAEGDYINVPNVDRRPLPSVPNGVVGSGYGIVNKAYKPALTPKTKMLVNRWQQQSESESGSEAGEIQRILYNGNAKEEEWSGDGKNRSHGNSEQSSGRSEEDGRKNRSNRREDPRRHTLSGDHHLGAGYQSHSVTRSMDLEMPLSRGYPPPSNAFLFDDDPGIMSEVETSSTGFRRGNKQRSSLPVVRTSSKTLERPLGLVFLQYRNETKRSLLPNEITSLDTVKALFVRSFPRQLTMEYLDSPQVKIYIHDSDKNMFYELEDLRSHLNEIQDRTILRLFEACDLGGSFPSGVPVPHQNMWADQDQSYFSEPEFDSEFQHQHIHKTKGTKANLAHQPYYMTHSFPPGSSQTLPSRASLLRTVPSPKSFMSSPERAAVPPRAYGPYGRALYEDPYYSQYGSRPSSITPIIDEETSDTELLDEPYVYSGVKLPTPAPVNRSPGYGTTTAPPFDVTRLRVENMERQLANLTGLVKKALTHNVPTEFTTPPDEPFTRSELKPPKLGKDKSVSFEKSVSFSDDPPDMNSPKQHSPLHTDSKPVKPAIKSSTLPRTSSQERERNKPVPPPKPLALTSQTDGRAVYRDLQLTAEMYNQLRGLQKKAKDLRQELRNLRRISQAQALSVKDTVRDAYAKIRSVVLNGGEALWSGGADTDRVKISREEDIYKQEVIRMEKDLAELEIDVEDLRNNVINRKIRVNMVEVENMALILSRSSKMVADLKLRFPSLHDAMKSLMAHEMERIVMEETFLKEEPERLELALKRCKKITGTLVTLKRLASVQEQRSTENRLSPTVDETPPITPTSGKHNGTELVVGSGDGGRVAQSTLDSLLDELKISAQPTPPPMGTLRRLHSYPSSEKPPVPERHDGKRVPPPPPPRTSSKSPLASPTNPNARKGSLGSARPPKLESASSNESINSQEGARQELESRHWELLRKQKALQEQYNRLQQLQKAPPDLQQLKKTGSESNILAKMGLTMSTPVSGSMSHIPKAQNENANEESGAKIAKASGSVYETEIL